MLCVDLLYSVVFFDRSDCAVYSVLAMRLIFIAGKGFLGLAGIGSETQSRARLDLVRT